MSLRQIGKDLAVMHSQMQDAVGIAAMTRENNVAIKVLQAQIASASRTSWIWAVVIGQMFTMGFSVYMALRK